LVYFVSMNNNEVYISTDIEADGPIPGPNSMLSLGAATYLPDGKLVGTFSVNLETLPDAQGDPDTMKWWSGRPQQWAECRRDPKSPKEAMTSYVDWVGKMPGRPVFVGYPATFDFLFVYWYLRRFVGESPFSFSALDIKSYSMAVLRTPFRDTTKKNMPKRWFQGLPKHTHVAVDDAIEQGALFCRILQENLNR
jgi:hypothetical protein